MKKLFPEDKDVYHLRDYAIIDNGNGTFDYIAWHGGQGEKKLGWVRGLAIIVEDILVLTRITDEGEEDRVRTIKEVRKELKKLPDWWDKTRFYCVIVGGQATLLTSCTSGKPVAAGDPDFARVQDILGKQGVALLSGAIPAKDRKPKSRPLP